VHSTYTASDKVYQLLAHGRWFSPGTPDSSTTKTGCHDIAEIVLKVALNTINQIKSNFLPKKGTKFTNRSVDNHYYIVRLKSYYHIIAATIILMAFITSATIILMALITSATIILMALITSAILNTVKPV
jgi:hypothetical protein